MLVSLARYHKSIAWFFVGLFYLELVLVPVAGRGEGRMAMPFRSARSYGLDVPYLSGKVSWSTGRNNPGAFTPLADKATALRGTMVPLAGSPLGAGGSAADGGGPGQPEMAAFTSVSSANMVDLFSGDFSYNIPLLDVGGYPVNLAYRAGVSMDQEASWVGLGWNINPGTITRNMRGLPDDFNGQYDSVRKVMSIKENKTIGVTGGADVEIAGFPKNKDGGTDTASMGSVGASLGVVHNNYRGWGLEHGINASINAAKFGKGALTAGLSITNSSMDGLSLAPSLSISISKYNASEDATTTHSFSITQPYNTRSGLKALQLGLGTRRSNGDIKNQKTSNHGYGSTFTSYLSFNSPGYTPTISMPYTSRQFSFTGKVGTEIKVIHPSYFLSGYVAKQYIAAADTQLYLPSYGYLHYQAGAQNRASLLDFNREKELPYREKPAVPHIAIPSYTYDAFSITGEGTGGMFRAYRADIGFIHDHFIRTKDASDRASVDIGTGDQVHGGIDLNINRVITQNGPWLNQNVIKEAIKFRKDSAGFQAVYFRNPGEKSINDRQFYETLGGDDVVTVGLDQMPNVSVINATNYLRRYKNGRLNGVQLLNAQNAVKAQRDKRTQVITYLSAQEAQAVGLAKYIEYHRLNAFDSASCVEPSFGIDPAMGSGLIGQYFKSKRPGGTLAFTKVAPVIDFDWGREVPFHEAGFINDKFSVRWTGRIKAPQTGTYHFYTTSDDGVMLWINDTLIIDHWKPRMKKHGPLKGQVNLVAGKMYNIRLEHYDEGGLAYIRLEWDHPAQQNRALIPQAFLFPPSAKDTFEHNNIVREQRVNRFRKANHISEIDVLNNDGRRYIYGIPVYNLKQRETTFSVDGKTNQGNKLTGLARYNHGVDNTTDNRLGKDWYFTSEEVPAYAHSFLLTGILSADYSDITGNGITDDDIGDAVKFNYTKVAGIANPYQWRAPAVPDSVTYNEGLKTDYRDDKGSYIYGEKELWYLHSIESKTMVATFVLEDRDDLPAIDEGGQRVNYYATKRLKEINLYSKSDFAVSRTNAKPVKTIHFEYTYELCKGAYGDTARGKLTLKKVWFTYNNNKKGQQNPYKFNYNSNNPAYNLKSNDRWGNYKDPLQNPGSSANNVITNADYSYALQDSIMAAQNAAAWALDSIYLPSGGSLKVQYESDDYAYVQDKRAMNMFRVIGAGRTSNFSDRSLLLYSKSLVDFDDHRYIFIRVPRPVSNVQELYHKYLAGIKKLYFKLSVRMPDNDNYGSGYENIPCYADLEPVNSYGVVNPEVIWVKLAGISLQGDGGGSYSPLVKAATQFLRLNLPSKAYPGSETGDDMDLEDAVKMLASLTTNITTAFKSFDRIARNRLWASQFDTLRSFVRLNNPFLKRMGGGHRVKRITVYDNWDKMASKPGYQLVRPAIYGQEYQYTTVQQLDKDSLLISSGVASYEPGIGGEENPFHVPVEYVEKIAPLGPVTLGYSEEPLGESFFPAANIGYSRVRVRTINYKNKKSANGFEETRFYTAYDYPTYVDRTFLDGETKKRYKPALANLLRVNAIHKIVLSQGFKVELNDMHGKMRSTASYAETDPVRPISYSEQFYRTDNASLDHKRLSNTVMVMKPDGTIDSAALIGKDVELMVDMREQMSITNGYNVPLNTDWFTVPFTPPYFLLPTMLNLAQREENTYRSVATTKVIQRYGILDSAIQIDKGSRISTKDVLYDSETGDVLLTRTQNEFNDPIYNFNYPSHWAYDGMGLAYKNIDVVLRDVNIVDGRMKEMSPTIEKLFSSGDELLIAGKQQTTDVPASCDDSVATFPDYDKCWAVDSSVLYGGPRAIYFIDRWGKAYTGYKLSLRIIRSGRRNILGAVGSVTSLDSLVKKNASGNYELVINANSKIIAASAGEFRQFWKTDDVLRKQPTISCIPNWQPNGIVRCLQSGGVNTGYQEISHTDVNPNSPTYNDTSLVVIQNCYECSRPAQWILADTFRCATDSVGNNLGFQYRGEIDTASCSATYGQYRWQIVAGPNCALCPKPAVWQFTTGDSCEKDANGINTGFIKRKQTNVESCSSNPGAIRWVTDTANCIMCPKPDEWIPIPDSIICAKDANGNNTGYLQRKEVNVQGCSDSGYATRWVLLGQNCDSCKKPANWQPIAGDSCQKINGVITGVRLKPQQNMESCSDSASVIKWVQYGSNCDSCKKSKNWQFVSGDTCTKDANGNNTGYRARRQQNIEACSDSANMYRWVSVYDTTVCSMGQCVYAKIVYENAQNLYNEDHTEMATTADIRVYFYSDTGRTVPVSVTNFALVYRIDYSEEGNFISSTNAQVVCNGTSKFIIRDKIYQTSTNQAPYIRQWDFIVPGTYGFTCSGGGGIE
ncbi:hypothetical protein HB364_16205 [Pseudoflavitalea sp. X16]|uniref:PA14 domain-containing protein n=1 Tax=Paraflavitalea devenefica TaxID=2716334 RepID=UPI001421CA7C|nr:PA14 domain-containing protein [Paraflavitalea devenefica]NII26633.1 hypothetical protein [Paraflavitalea devenefica]